MNKILIVEDERDLRGMLSFSLKSYDFLIFEAANTIEAKKQISQNIPNIILLDVMMPGQSGFDFVAELRRTKKTAKIPIIMLTALESEEDKVKGLNLGADDYITKPFSQKLLIARINALLRRTSASTFSSQPQSVVNRGHLSLNPESYSCKWKGKEVKLTLTEFMLLAELAARPGHVKQRHVLMDAAYPDNMDVDDRTIDSHIKRIRKKFKRHDNEFDEIETLYGAGYRLKDPQG